MKEPTIPVRVFVSALPEHVDIALSQRVWATPINDVGGIGSRVSRVSIGDLGIFYVARKNGSGGYLRGPFRFATVPLDEVAQENRHLWLDGRYRFGFRFQPLGAGVDRMGQMYLRTLRIVQDYRNQKLSHALNLVPRYAWIPVQFPLSDWDRIIRCCEPG